MNARLWKAVDRRFLASDIDGAIKYLEKHLRNERTDPFKGLIGAQFANKPFSILSGINKFIQACDQSFDVKAVYLEMNGFDFNYDRWHFDFFGYKTYCGDANDLDWLSDWQSQDWRSVTLKGLESIQSDYRCYREENLWKDGKYEKTYAVARLLVMTKFVVLIQSALQAGNLVKPIPVLATAHDFDIIGRFEP